MGKLTLFNSESSKLVDEKETVYVDRVVEKFVDKIVYVDKPVQVEKVVYVDKPIEVEKKVVEEKIVYVDKPVEVFVDRPVVQEKVIYKDVIKEVPVIEEKTVYVDKVIYKEKVWSVALSIVEALIIVALLVK